MSVFGGQRQSAVALALAGLAAAMPAGASPVEAPEPLPVVTVSADGADLIGVADAASEGRVTGRQLAARPLLRPAEVLEAIPGMVVTQHSGDGKANQYFLRGFNLDHGSDFATFVAGVPVNLPSHAHGQGYTDLNFLIPELVAEVRFRKGPYAAEDGDFATAGSARIDLRRRLEAPFVDVASGRFGYRRVLTAGQIETGVGAFLAALEASGYDGPWTQPEGLARQNLVLRLSDGPAGEGYALTLMAYQAQWTATEHVPARAIEAGEIGRFGALSAHDGGRTHRLALSGEWGRGTADGRVQGSLYAVDYGLNLFSNPSGFISGPQGDQHEQVDGRRVLGGQVRRDWYVGDATAGGEFSVGAQVRQDRIGTLGLYTTESRMRTLTVRTDRVVESAAAVFAEVHGAWHTWLRPMLGLRYDRLAAQVSPLAGTYNLDNGGSARAGRFSPRAGVVLGPVNLPVATEFYANWGEGFHSNDARGATSRRSPFDGQAIASVPLLVRARSAELGMRSTLRPGWTTTLSVWRMRLASELVFVGDEGVTEPRGGSSREGIEWTHQVDGVGGWQMDASLALSRARFQDPDPDTGGKDVPNAVPVVVSLGATRDVGGRWFAGVRGRHVGAYSLEPTGQVRSSGFWTAGLRGGFRLTPKAQVSVDVLNLFNSRANDIEYWGRACTRGENAAGLCDGGLEGRLVHPLEPRAFRVSLRWGF